MPDSLPRVADLVVIGGGVVGLAAARAFRLAHPDASVVVLEKEARCGAHASGRNSGVLHAGFYYTADSLKARFSREGCAAWKAWCDERGLPVNRCGKLVVARDEAELAGLDELLARGERNGVEVERITAADARAIEPRVRTAERALWSPTTASIDPGAVMEALVAEVRGMGVRICTGTGWRGVEGDVQRTDRGTVAAGHVLNAAGLHADRVAAAFGHGVGLRILPFKGLYLYGDEPAGWLRTHVYPVPDLRFPFLGVHFTVTVEGHAKIGPTAFPALWREQYRGLSGFSARELVEVLGREARMLVGDRAFRALAREEVDKAARPRLVARAAGLVDGVDPRRWRRWGAPGIRAQLVDVESGALVTDFRVEGDRRSTHVLNAVSPAFTCALPFGRWLVGRMGAAA